MAYSFSSLRSICAAFLNPGARANQDDMSAALGLPVSHVPARKVASTTTKPLSNCPLALNSRRRCSPP